MNAVFNLLNSSTKLLTTLPTNWKRIKNCPVYQYDKIRGKINVFIKIHGEHDDDKIFVRVWVYPHGGNSEIFFENCFYSGGLSWQTTSASSPITVGKWSDVITALNEVNKWIEAEGFLRRKAQP